MFSQYVESFDDEARPRQPMAPITRRLRGLAKASSKLSDRELFERAVLARKGR